MRVLIDECLPAGLKDSLVALGYEAETVRRAGYGARKNGELLELLRLQLYLRMSFHQPATSRGPQSNFLKREQSHYFSLANSALACFRTGMSGSVSFHRVRKSW